MIRDLDRDIKRVRERKRERERDWRCLMTEYHGYFNFCVELDILNGAMECAMLSFFGVKTLGTVPSPAGKLPMMFLDWHLCFN